MGRNSRQRVSVITYAGEIDRCLKRDADGHFVRAFGGRCYIEPHESVAGMWVFKYWRER